MSDTSGFDVNEKVNILFKTAMGFPSTKESTNWFQETNVPYNTYVFGSDILTDDIPANPTYGAAKTSASVGLTDSDFDTGGFVKDSTDGKVRYYHRLILDQCITNNNDSWHKKNSSGDNVLMDALQFNVQKTDTNTPYGYVLTNKANVAADSTAPNEILQNAAGGNWFFDIKSGIVFFPDNSTPSLGVVDNDTKKPVFSFYKYIGNKGLSTWSGGGGGGGGGSTTLGGLTDVSTTGATSGQAIVYNGSSWAPGNVASGGGGSGQITTSETQFANCIQLKPKSNWSYTPTAGWQSVYQNLEIETSIGTVSSTITTAPANIKTYIETLAGRTFTNDFTEGLSTNDSTIIFNKSGLYRITMYTGPSACHVLGDMMFQQMGYIFDKNNNGKYELSGAPSGQCSGASNSHLYKATKDDYVVFLQRRGNGGTANYATDTNLRLNQGIDIEYIPDTVQIGGNGEAVLDGQVLETLVGVCDGRSLTVQSGTYTLPVGTKQELSGDPFVDVNGTNISYKPPSGTKQVVYSILLHIGAIMYGQTDIVLNFIVSLDGNEITNSLITERPGNLWSQGWINVQFVFDIGNVSSDDYTTGKLASWDTHKIIKVMGREGESGSYGAWINSNHNTQPYDTNANTYGVGQVYPQMTIKAIGRGKSGVALVGTNMVNKRITNTAVYTNISGPVIVADTITSATEITEFEIKITPEYSDSVIHIEWNFWFEANENNVFRIVRFVNGVSTIFSNDDPTGESGYAVSKYDTDASTTPNQIIMDLYDEPNTTTEVTYKVYISYIYTSTTARFVLNRGYSDTHYAADAPNSTSEKIVSTVKAIEHPKPNKALNPITSATQVEGQVLETLAGLCDGRSITVSSGTYTLENVTGRQNGTMTFTPITGSRITYKPPPGTKQVIYEFTVHVIPNSDGASVNLTAHYKMYLGGTEVEIMYNTHQLRGQYPETEYNIQMIINIGEKNDIANAHILNWDTPLEMRVDGQSYDNIDDEVTWHKQYYFQGVNVTSDESKYQHPTLKITAIGTADYDVVQRVVTYKDGQVLEVLNGICDGRSVTVASGTYTLPKVTALQDLTETMVDLTGSNISYKPPVGTNTVIYKWKYRTNINDGTFFNMGYQLYIDNVAFGDVEFRGNQEYQDSYDELEVIINITGTDDYNNHSISSWNSLKTLKLKGRERASTRQSEIHATGWYTTEVGGDAYPAVRPPRMTITAIGRQVAPASAADFKIQKVDTISTPPNNGNMLTWDAAKGRWKPSEFIVENNDGTKNISDLNLYHGYQVSTSSVVDDQTTAEDAFRKTEAYLSSNVKKGAWESAYNTYSTSGDYTGSQTTNGYVGEWVQINFNKKVKVYHYHITPIAPSNSSYDRYKRAPKEYKVFGSNDGTTWVEVHSGTATTTDYTGSETPTDYQKNRQFVKTNTLSTPATYQYFRLVINKTLGDTSTQASLSYLAFYGNFPNERIQTLPVSGVNMVNTSFETKLTLTVPNTVPGIEVEPARLVITPTATDSVIRLEYSIFCDGAVYNDGFRITRNINGTDVLVVPASNKWEGFVAMIHGGEYGDGATTHNNVATTVNVLWYDEPNTTSQVTYKLWLGNCTAQSKTITINKCLGGTDSGAELYELGVSTGAAIEHPKPQSVMSSVNNSTAVDGQVLETLAGVCDGRSLTVSSGTYTLPNVTTSLSLTSTYTTVTGSEISYTPPPNTKQVIYIFKTMYSRDTTAGSTSQHITFNCRLYIDNVEQTGFRRTYGGLNFEGHFGACWTIDIGSVSSTDNVNSRFPNWTTPKTIKIEAREWDNTAQTQLHSTEFWDGTSTDVFSAPQLEIQAIGTADYDVVQRVVTYKDGQVLETLAGKADGSTITVSSGTYTMPISTIAVNTEIGTSYIKEPASEITYKAPTGTERIIFEFVGLYHYADAGAVINGKFYVDDVEYQGSGSYGHFKKRSGDNMMGQNYFPQMVITSQQYDLTVPHNYYWKIRSETSSHNFKYGYGGSDLFTENTQELKITAIGRQVAPASAADFKIQKVDTLSPLNDPESGSLLMWDGGKKKWRASSSRMEDLDIRLLSDPAVHVGHEHNASSIHNDSDEYYEPHHAFNYTQSSYYSSVWASAASNYNTTTGAYTGSTTTEGYNGEWIQINLKRKAKIYYYGVMAEKRLDVKRCPKSWRLYGSNNGSSWTQLDEQQDRLFDNWWSKNQSSEWPSGTTSQHASVMWGMNLQKIELSQPASYQYFRMVINESNGTDTKVHLNFLGFYGVWPTQSLSTVVSSGSNMVHAADDVYKSVTISQYTSPLDYEYQEMRMVITPQYSDSVIELKYNIFGDIAENVYFRITRNINGTDVLVTNGSAPNEGVLGIGYYNEAGDEGSTPCQHTISWYDDPNTTSTVTYKLWLGSKWSAGGSPIHLNRSGNALSGDYSETGVSTGAAIEHPKPQAILSSVRSETAVDGQVLETLTGVCDGRSVAVASGIYTLPNVTAAQTTTTSYVDITGSSIENYKPPTGTKQVIYDFSFQVNPDFGDSTDAHNGRYLIYIKMLIYHNGAWASVTNQIYNVSDNHYNYGESYTFRGVIDITGTDDISNGKLSSWDTPKSIVLQVGSSQDSYRCRLHSIRYGGGPGTTTVTNISPIRPKIKIQAIGTAQYDVVQRTVSLKSGQLLENIVGICDGRTITASSGTYTLENVDAILDLNTTYQDITGSKIIYKPPAGTRQLIYTFRWYWRFGPEGTPHDNQSIFSIKLFLDGSEVTSFNGTRAHGYYEMMYHEESFIFEIGDTDDIANGKINGWNSLKEIKLQARDAFSGSHETTFHKQWAQGDVGAIVHKPNIEIRAIGDSGTAAGGVISESRGNVGIGTTSPTEKLQLSSTNVITDGTNGTKLAFSKIESGNDVNIGALAGHGDSTGGGVVLYNSEAGESHAGGYVSTSSSYAFYAAMSGSAGYWSSGNFGWSATFIGDRHLANSPYIDHGQSNVKFIVNNPGSSVKIRWRSSFNDSGKGLYYSASTSNANYTRHTTSTSWQERELNHGYWFGWNSGSGIQYEVYILPNIPAYSTSSVLKPNVILNKVGNLGVGKVNDASGVMYDYKKLVVYQTGTSHGIYSEGTATQTNYAFAARNSSGTDTWAITYNGTTAVSSDDRLKHNEIELTNVLDIIDKLKPKRYFKTSKMFDENFNLEVDPSGNPITSEEFHIETGLIAQEVNTIPELQYCVGGGGNEITGEQPYNVNYNDIFVYNIAATKELHKKVISLETKNIELENKVKELENKVKESEMKVNTVYNKNALLEAEISLIKNKIGL